MVIALAGAMCLWSGFMRIADKAGITKAIAKLFSPLLRLLFPGLPTQSRAAKAMSMNISANLLGMGNAATPFGITAMKELAAISETPGEADDRMITFVVIFGGAILLGGGLSSGAPLPTVPEWVLTALPVLLVILAAGGYGVSYAVAQGIYARKEF